MIFVDTHTHLYSKQFDSDRDAMVGRALQSGVKYLLLPNIDTESIPSMQQLCASYPQNCFPMMGLHPCHVKADYTDELKQVETALFNSEKYIAVGEIGLDFYWDKTLIPQQEEAFLTQCRWAMQLDLPVAIHSRESTYRAIELLQADEFKTLKGVFHCFGGTPAEAQEITRMGFHLGIGGVLTYKNANLPQALADIDPCWLLLETDSPYLAPVPYRGKRNESSYIPVIAEQLAAVYQLSLEEMARITTANAQKLFARVQMSI